MLLKEIVHFADVKAYVREKRIIAYVVGNGLSGKIKESLRNRGETYMKKKIILISIICMSTLLGGCSSCSRMSKSISSDMDGGLNRTVTAYDYDGKVIKTWTGKFDVSSSENEVYFDDSNGKRVIIHGGIIINEEN